MIVLQQKQYFLYFMKKKNIAKEITLHIKTIQYSNLRSNILYRILVTVMGMLSRAVH